MECTCSSGRNFSQQSDNELTRAFAHYYTSLLDSSSSVPVPVLGLGNETSRLASSYQIGRVTLHYLASLIFSFDAKIDEPAMGIQFSFSCNSLLGKQRNTNSMVPKIMELMRKKSPSP